MALTRTPRKFRKQGGKPESSAKAVIGEKPGLADPVANLLMADIALRAGTYLLRSVIERKFLLSKYDPGKAREILAKRSKTQTVTSFAAAKIATKSVPGAILVGGGILAKGLFDRGRKRRNKRRLAGTPSPKSLPGNRDE